MSKAKALFGPSFVVVLAVIMLMFTMAGLCQAGCPGNMTDYWKLNETSGTTFFDQIGSNNATCSGSSCPSFAAGKINGALSFNGSSQGIFVPPSASFNWKSIDSFSIELWMKTDVASTCTGGEAIMGRAGNPYPNWTVQCLAGGKAAFNLVDKNGTSSSISSNALVTGGNWHHIVAVRDATNNKISLYIDGKLEASQIMTYSAGFDSTAPLSIGGLNLPNLFSFKGTIDEVALYNRALSPREIQSHYFLDRGYCDMCSTPVRIMPVGDSITEGCCNGQVADTDHEHMASYRQTLYLDLEDSGYIVPLNGKKTVDFVGSQKFGALLSPPFDIDNEGHPGWTASCPLGPGQVVNEIYNWLSANPADVVLLHIGTNDVANSCQDVNGIASILDEIDNFSKNTTVILARIINQKTPIQAVTDFNNAVQAMAQSRIANGDKVMMVDEEDALTYPDDMSDLLHPIQAGYDKMAGPWFDALKNFLPYCGQTITVSPPSSDFGSVSTGVSAPAQLVITNTGSNGDLSVDTMTITGNNDFSIVSENCSSLMPSGSCTVNIAFNPSSIGSKTATLSIPSNDPNTPTLTVPLIGTGTPPAPRITVTDLSVAFPSTTVGLSSAQQTVTIGNSGTLPLSVSKIQLAGTDTTDFILNVGGGTSPCSSTHPTLNPGDNCTVTVTFSPQSPGVKTASLQITSNDPDQRTIGVALSGTGLSSASNNPPTPPVLVSPADGQTGLDTGVTFVWNKTTDPDGDAVSYNLYYCQNQSFAGCTPTEVASAAKKTLFYAGTFGSGAGLVFFGIALAGGATRRRKIMAILALVVITGLILVSCGGGGGGDSAPVNNEVSYTASGLGTGTTYYWKVVAVDGKGGISQSSVRSFTTR